MLDARMIERLLEAQRRSYRLLLWMGTAVDRGLISLDAAAHVGSTPPERAQRWVTRHHQNLPADARPTSEGPDDVRLFANVFASYLDTSFEWTASPRPRLESSCGCPCEICAVLVAGPHLRTRKVTGAHKRRARRLTEDALRQLALDEGRPLIEADLEAICSDDALREDLAIHAYVVELARRAQGVSEGPAVLALWRTFAWTREGSPRKRFELTASQVRAAEDRLRKRIAATTA